ncbi:MAG TPA: type II secretion system protein GspG [Spirochaetia bacterium]|nr:type II secretion system protein GspG [Spirochaetia bacterium]
MLLPSLVLTACGGRAINPKNAQEIIASQGHLGKDTLDIESVSQTGPGEAVVQARLPAAFRLEKVHGKWEIRDVRVGNDQWEKLDDFVAALNAVKTEETRKMLGEVANAIDRYREKNGRLPDFKDYVSLSDALNPDYLTTLIRLDAWRHPLAAVRTATTTVQLISAGPDGKIGTADDIVLTRSYPPPTP